MIETRRATTADLPACAAIINDWLDEVDWMRRVVGRESVKEAFEPGVLDRRTMFVAGEGEVAGYLSLDEPEHFIRGFYLKPSARGQGIGKALMDAAKQRCPDRLELGVFEANEGAVRFYEREGFVAVPEGYKTAAETDEGVPELLMRWAPL